MKRRTFLSLLTIPIGFAGSPPAIEKAFHHLFNFDFPSVHAATADSLQDPIALAVRAAAFLFEEFVNLKIWEGDDFFGSGRRSKAKPDPHIRTSFFAALSETRHLANAMLDRNQKDISALFAYMMSYGLETDYLAFLERRAIASFDTCKKGQVWADRLLAADPQFHDAYLTTGTNEYMLGALPGVVRWAVKVETAKGDKQKGLYHLELTARNGRYFPAFAKLLLAVFYEREKQFSKATAMLQELAASHPRNQLFTAQLIRLRQKSA